jgi:hypothetical protein
MQACLDQWTVVSGIISTAKNDEEVKLITKKKKKQPPELGNFFRWQRDSVETLTKSCLAQNTTSSHRLNFSSVKNQINCGRTP